MSKLAIIFKDDNSILLFGKLDSKNKKSKEEDTIIIIPIPIKADMLTAKISIIVRIHKNIF
jgi:hypothetical protein